MSTSNVYVEMVQERGWEEVEESWGNNILKCAMSCSYNVTEITFWTASL